MSIAINGLSASGIWHLASGISRLSSGAILPPRWNAGDIGRFMVFFGAIFDVLTFSLTWWFLHANTPEAQTLFQSGWQ
ncbi:hypothetical protein J8655_09575 [Dickeya oryzae]|uniref:hypothetical protein n=1 Tax=Dickeya oryzae TaxID=1240404 RepID=UPI001AECE132|nr:hypothetical protein [Dickeya oryzae]MBP2845726.1 hypothetical protein [Dickeya oryzae]